MRVYNLMKDKWARKALRNRRLKLSLFEDMNDPFELFPVSFKKEEDRQMFTQLREVINTDVGVLCFSRTWSNPVLWSHYGERHKGICLGFVVPDECINKINYVEKRIELEELEDSAGEPKKMQN